MIRTKFTHGISARVDQKTREKLDVISQTRGVSICTVIREALEMGLTEMPEAGN